MRQHLSSGGPGGPGDHDPLTDALRALYAAPGGDGYWDALEQRIMARVSEPGEWWQVVAGWTRVGLVAAGIAACIAVAAAAQAREAAAARLAYEAVLEVAPTATLQSATQGERLSEREAALRYMISY
jgi:hypothetical protein